LKHYGAPMMKTFVGAGDAAWTHLTTAKVNDKGAISGAHDAKVFLDYVAANGFELVGNVPPAAIYKVQYRKKGTGPAPVPGPILGSKTLIQGLSGKKVQWLKTFNDAIWKGVADKKLTTGQYTVKDAGGDQYGGFYNAGKDEVDTVFPA
jgi:hypothetical protein